jgi:hypothetical protein
LNGIAISIVQPLSSRWTLASQTVFQSELALRSSLICESLMAPNWFVWKK